LPEQISSTFVAHACGVLQQARRQRPDLNVSAGSGPPQQGVEVRGDQLEGRLQGGERPQRAAERHPGVEVLGDHVAERPFEQRRLQGAALAPVEPADRAAVEQRDAAVAGAVTGEDQVAGMGSAWKVPTTAPAPRFGARHRPSRESPERMAIVAISRLRRPRANHSGSP